MKSPGRPIFIMFLFVCLCSSVFCQDLSIDRIINPFGWKLPDVAYLEKVSTEVKTYCGIPQRIIVETYEYTGKNLPQHKMPYIILDKQILPGGLVNFNAEVREWVKRLEIYKREDYNQIICYLFDCVKDLTTWDEIKEHLKRGAIDGTSGPWTSNVIFDMDDDGIFESLRSDIKQEEVITYVLKFKLGII